MAGGAALLADRRQMLADCADSLRDLHDSLYQCTGSELRDLAGDLAELRALCGAQLVAVVAEAESRGVIAESQYAGTSAWVADAAWHSRRESATIAKAARLLRRNDLEPIAHAVLTVDLDPATAVSVATEFDKLAPDLRDDAKPLVLEQFLTVAAEQGPNGVRQLKQEILSRYGDNGEFDDHQDRCRRQIDLSAGRESSAGVWDYRFTTDNEGRAVLEAAIGPLSAPQPNQETGETDPRPAGQRRGEA